MKALMKTFKWSGTSVLLLSQLISVFAQASVASAPSEKIQCRATSSKQNLLNPILNYSENKNSSGSSDLDGLTAVVNLNVVPLPNSRNRVARIQSVSLQDRVVTKTHKRGKKNRKRIKKQQEIVTEKAIFFKESKFVVSQRGEKSMRTTASGFLFKVAQYTLTKVNKRNEMDLSAYDTEDNQFTDERKSSYILTVTVAESRSPKDRMKGHVAKAVLVSTDPDRGIEINFDCFARGI